MPMPSINLSGLRNIPRVKALLAEGQPIDLLDRKLRIGRIIPQSVNADLDAGKWPDPPEQSSSPASPSTASSHDQQ
jgi:hypothetical protein